MLETRNVKKVKMLIVYPLLELQHDRALVNALYIRDSLNSTGGVVYMLDVKHSDVTLKSSLIKNKMRGKKGATVDN